VGRRNIFEGLLRTLENYTYRKPRLIRPTLRNYNILFYFLIRDLILPSRRIRLYILSLLPPLAKGRRVYLVLKL
jgi:hypothetical protein